MIDGADGMGRRGRWAESVGDGNDIVPGGGKTFPRWDIHQGGTFRGHGAATLSRLIVVLTPSTRLCKKYSNMFVKTREIKGSH